MIECLIVGLGGAIGAVGRYLIGLFPLDPESGFPVKTLLINVAGAFVIGIIGALAAKDAMSPRMVMFIKVGICGGFTTFSSFALETHQLIGKGQSFTALMYMALSIFLGLAAVWTADRMID